MFLHVFTMFLICFDMFSVCFSVFGYVFSVFYMFGNIFNINVYAKSKKYYCLVRGFKNKKVYQESDTVE